MQSLTLYQCERELQAALDAALDKETGEIASSEELDNAIGQFKNKGAHVAAYVLNLKAQYEMIVAHEKAIAAKKKAVSTKIDRLHDYMAFNMANAGIARIDAIDGTFSAQLYAARDESIEIDEAAPIDDRFARIVPETKAWDKAALKRAIKAHEPVPSCVKLVKKDRLEIK
jgi:Siphovirus Gp157